jgi:hypothetical protein
MNPAIPAFAVVLFSGAAFLLWLFVSAALLLWGARLAGIEQRSFGRAIGTILLGGIASILLKLVLFGSAPLVGAGLGILLGFCVSSVVMMTIFDTTFGKALAANILAWVLSIFVAVVFVLFAAFLVPILLAGAA